MCVYAFKSRGRDANMAKEGHRHHDTSHVRDGINDKRLHVPLQVIWSKDTYQLTTRTKTIKQNIEHKCYNIFFICEETASLSFKWLMYFHDTMWPVHE